MNIPPLCVIQARYHSTRLEGKMLLELGGETLIARAWRIAVSAFGKQHCVVAMVTSDLETPLGEETERIQAQRFTYSGDESDLLSRFYYCAHTFRWHPDSVIVRYTPDDPWKDPRALQRVAKGERLPVELGGEAFTLAQLDAAVLSPFALEREHLTDTFFPGLPGPDIAVGWMYDQGLSVYTIDTPEDYEACVSYLANHA